MSFSIENDSPGDPCLVDLNFLGEKRQPNGRSYQEVVILPMLVDEASQGSSTGNLEIWTRGQCQEAATTVASMVSSTVVRLSNLCSEG